jgi:hypothetical protein
MELRWFAIFDFDNGMPFPARHAHFSQLIAFFASERSPG